MKAPQDQPVGGSLRRALVLGIGVPVLAFLLLNSVTVYRQALEAANTAYDRTLLASAKTIGELLEVQQVSGRPVLSSTLTYAALEAFEADNRSRMVYKVTGFDGETVAGFHDLPSWQGPLPDRNLYAALVHFYDAQFRDEPVRVAVLLQPVAGAAGIGMATVQVAETLELRRDLARELLVQTIWQQGLLLVVVALVVALVTQRAMRPVRVWSEQVRARAENDLSPLPAQAAPSELRPMVEATNDLMARLSHLLGHQKRFVRDTSHQLRTPLAVLKTQVQSALRGDVEPRQALTEIEQTVSGATDLANQMLALAKVEQLRQQGSAGPSDWSEIVKAVSLDLSALIADKSLDFELDAQPVSLPAHEWMLRELTRNLLHNAIRHSPPQGALTVRLKTTPDGAELQILDDGPGIDDDLRQRLFQPFSRGGGPHTGSAGLGLSICKEITLSLEGDIRLDNRPASAGRPSGLTASVRLPLTVPIQESA